MSLINAKNSNFLKNSGIKEMFSIMRPGDISLVAKNDPLIYYYGEALLSKHKRPQVAYLISNKLRKMVRLLIIFRQTDPTSKGLFNFLYLEKFSVFVYATKCISDYNEEEKDFNYFRYHCRWVQT